MHAGQELLAFGSLDTGMPRPPESGAIG